ncbi:uncharacterized protein LOC108476482 isoform X1 [Gossypium arboreum]|uniref:uncharacterized protein LOC108476482 isoform X1 n=1 Tax=Gossypium arboreum TaxID=29729 RepID=UPI0022F19448|nr:uncharacterized protein LOC108476482 isoform X1 [Gossypium arboreum]
MEEAVKEQQSAAQISGSAGKSKLRYPLRSSMKPKEQKPPAPDLSNSSSSRRGFDLFGVDRGRATPSVSKSVGVLDLSKEKSGSGKPPRRLSIPTKSTVTPSPKFVGTTTPIYEGRAAKKSTNGQGKSDTPLSDSSRSSTRRRFNVLSSASYWLSQIKLSESASKHSVSLGFFKIALEAGCEPLQKMSDELKSYIRRHNLGENGEAINELLESYNVPDNPEQPQVSETCSQVPDEGTRSSDDEVHRVSPVAAAARRLKPKSLNTDAARVSSVAKSAKEATPKNNAANRNRLLNKTSSNSRSVSDTGSRKLHTKTQKTTKTEPVKGKEKTKGQGTESADQEDQVCPSAAAETVEEDKENMDALLTEESSLSGVM